jgi:hypothetical protein
MAHDRIQFVITGSLLDSDLGLPLLVALRGRYVVA